MVKIGCSWQIWNKATNEVDIKRDYLDKFGRLTYHGRAFVKLDYVDIMQERVGVKLWK